MNQPSVVTLGVTFKPYQITLLSLKVKKVAILSGWSITPQLRADFPNIEFVGFPTWNRH
ncbi:hypothetical protein O9929_21380 [Vibrio lentus]|nr:hypothetical protein [Vibrio lentus]